MMTSQNDVGARYMRHRKWQKKKQNIMANDVALVVQIDFEFRERESFLVKELVFKLSRTLDDCHLHSPRPERSGLQRVIGNCYSCRWSCAVSGHCAWVSEWVSECVVYIFLNVLAYLQNWWAAGQDASSHWTGVTAFILWFGKRVRLGTNRQLSDVVHGKHREIMRTAWWRLSAWTGCLLCVDLY